MPDVTIVMGVYNVERYLQIALASIQAQTHTNWELIAIDDCSTDASYELLGSIAARDRRIKVFRNNENLGLASTLNVAISRSQSDIICRMDPDDICMPRRLETQLRFLQTHASVIAVSGWCKYIDENGDCFPEDHQPVFLPEYADPAIIRELLCESCIPIHPATMFRKSAFNDAGGYRNKVGAAEDWDLWLRMAEYGDFVCQDDIVVHYRRSAISTTIGNPALNLISYRIIQKCVQLRRDGRSDADFLNSIYLKYGRLTETTARHMVSGDELVKWGAGFTLHSDISKGKLYARLGLARFPRISVYNACKALVIITGLFSSLYEMKVKLQARKLIFRNSSGGTA